jgi:hypothetical protein
LCQRGDHAAPDWVPGSREHDGDCCGCLLCGRDRASHRNNDIDLEPDKFGRDLGISLGASLGSQSQRCGPRSVPVRATAAQKRPSAGSRLPVWPNASTRWLAVRGRLCACRDWPRCRRATDNRYELMTVHSSNSSSRMSKDNGTSIPSILAVCRLTSNSTLAGCSTGRSAGGCL